MIKVATFLAPAVRPLYEAVTEAIGLDLGTRAELVVGRSYEQFLDDSNEVAFICSLPYVEFERRGLAPAEPIAAPILYGARYGGSPIYFADVVVNAESHYQRFSDLRGGTWAYNDELSQSGYGLARNHLIELGETDGFFGEVVKAGLHRRSVELVASGRVDGAAIDSQVLAIHLRDHPRLRAELRVITSLGPSTIQPIVVSRRLPEDIKDRIRGVVVGLHQNRDARPAFDGALVERFVPVDARSYDDVRAMRNRSLTAGFEQLR